MIVTAATRGEAAQQLAAALARAHIHGVTTNRDLLVRVLRHPAFLAGEVDTHFLDRHGVAQLAAPLADHTAERLHAVTAALTGQATRRAAAPVLPTLPSGWRNNPSQLHTAAYGRAGRTVVGYRLGRGVAALTVDGAAVSDIEGSGAHRTPPTFSSTASAGGSRCTGSATRRTSTARWAPRRCARCRASPAAEPPTAAGSLVAPMPGLLVRVAVAAGDAVLAGEVLVVLEAMKMEHPVTATRAGTVRRVLVAPGQQVETGSLLVVLEEVDDV